ncbi:hypothetical protein GCM10009582_08400 [Arthrobacter flavus]
MSFAPTDTERSTYTNRLGTIAMRIGIVAAVGSLVASTFVGSQLGPLEVESAQGLSESERSLLIACFAALGSQVLWLGLSLWALIQGAVAVSKRRGRQQGIVAIWIAIGAPVISFVLFVGLTLITSPLG